MARVCTLPRDPAAGFLGALQLVPGGNGHGVLSADNMERAKDQGEDPLPPAPAPADPVRGGVFWILCVVECSADVGPQKFEERLLSSVPPEWAGPLLVIIASFAMFCALWMLIAKRPTSRRILKKFKLQPATEDCYSQFCPKTGSSHRFFKAELATRVVSTVHACICCNGALRCLWMEREGLFDDMLWKTLPATKFYFSISLAYFIGDLLVCSVQFREYGVLFVLHALSSLVALALICFGDMFHFLGCVGLLWELSTIFINNRWALLEYGYKNTFWFHLNGFTLVAVFCVVRLAVGLPLSYLFWAQLSMARADELVGRGMYLLVTTVLAGFNALNVYWSYKLSSRCLGIVRRWWRERAARRRPASATEYWRERGADRERRTPDSMSLTGSTTRSRRAGSLGPGGAGEDDVSFRVQANVLTTY